MDKTYNCPICGTEGFGFERLPMSDLYRRLNNISGEWWYCSGCDDHLPVREEEE